MKTVIDNIAVNETNLSFSIDFTIRSGNIQIDSTPTVKASDVYQVMSFTSNPLSILYSLNNDYKVDLNIIISLKQVDKLFNAITRFIAIIIHLALKM